MLKSAAAAGVTRQGVWTPATLPDAVSNATFFYSANQGPDFTDQSGNGNNGTITTVGSGGVSSLTHTTGRGAYWQLTTSDSTSEQKYVETPVSPGIINSATTTSWTLAVVNYQTANAFALMAIDGGGGPDGISLNVQYDDYMRGAWFGSYTVQVLSSTTYSTDTWYLIASGHGPNGSSTFGSGTSLWVNNSVVGNTATVNDLNVSDNLRIGFDTLTFSAPNDFKIAAVGWWADYSLTSGDLTAFYNYYNQEVGL